MLKKAFIIFLLNQIQFIFIVPLMLSMTSYHNWPNNRVVYFVKPTAENNQLVLRMNEWIAWFSLGIKVFPSPPPSSLCNSCRTETNLALHVSASVAIFCITWFLLLFLVLFERLFFCFGFHFFWEGLDGWIVSSFGTNVFFFSDDPFCSSMHRKKTILFDFVLFSFRFGS